MQYDPSRSLYLLNSRGISSGVKGLCPHLAYSPASDVNFRCIEIEWGGFGGLTCELYGEERIRRGARLPIRSWMVFWSVFTAPIILPNHFCLRKSSFIKTI
jgi:hypothetical protein